MFFRLESWPKSKVYYFFLLNTKGTRQSNTNLSFQTEKQALECALISMNQQSEFHIWRKYLTRNYVIQVYSAVNCVGHDTCYRGWNLIWGNWLLLIKHCLQWALWSDSDPFQNDLWRKDERAWGPRLLQKYCGRHLMLNGSIHVIRKRKAIILYKTCCNSIVSIVNNIAWHT